MLAASEIHVHAAWTSLILFICVSEEQIIV